MSAAETATGVVPAERKPLPGWGVVLLAWLIMITLVGGAGPFRGDGWPPISGDDAWRLAEFVDLADGQAWTDTTQYRDNTPFGGPMHWSRLIDAPLAVLTIAFRPFYGADAPLAAASLWPLLLLLPFVLLISLLAERMAGPAARVPAIAVMMLATISYEEFLPGRVDHHNAQMILILGLMLATVGGRTNARVAAVAGLIAATCIAIGTECLPAVIAALFFFPLFWVMDPERSRTPAVAFAAAFGLGLLAHLVAVTNPASYFAARCDALSIVYVVAGLAYAAAVIGVTMVASRVQSALLRIVAMGAGGGVALGLTLVLFPACAGGPYANLDPDLAAILLTELSEAQPIWRWIGNAIGGGSGLLFLPIVGLVAAIIAAAVHRGDKRMDWIVIAGFSVMLVIVTMLQSRGIRLALLPTYAVGGWAISTLWQRFRTTPGIVSGAKLALGVYAFAGIAHILTAFVLFPGIPKSEQMTEDYNKCLLRENYAHLAALPEGRIVTYILIGTQILLNTQHSIVSAGYHRSEQGLRDALAFISGGEDAAKKIAAERGLNYLVKCRGVPLEHGLYGVPSFEGVVDDVAKWSWLNPITGPDEPIEVYAIDLPTN